MASSGTYLFNPSIAQVTVQAFHMCGIRPTALLQEHMESARLAANFVLADWGNRGVNLWKVESVNVPFVQGNASYSVSPNLVDILDLYITINAGSAAGGGSNSDFNNDFNNDFGGTLPGGAGGVGFTNRYLYPVSRTEYVSYPNPQQQAQPTVYWHSRTLTPTLNFYPTPDGNEASFTYYAVQQIQDANLTNGEVADLPYLWLPAFVKALAAELSVMWAPERADGLTTLAEKAWTSAALTNTEQSAFYISPTLSGYWRV